MKLPASSLGVFIGLAIVGGAVAAAYSLTDSGKDQATADAFGKPVSAGYADIARYIGERITQISPTDSFSDTGWIVHRVSFLKGTNLAYVEYTDTHVALRLLAEYAESRGSLATRVLATFVPNESGGWDLAYGTDTVRDKIQETYIYNSASGLWVQE